MQRTTPRLRSHASGRLAELARQRPEWTTWLRLVGETVRAMDAAAWQVGISQAEPGGAVPGPPDGSPLLHGRSIQVEGARLQRLVGALARAAAPGSADGSRLARYRPSVQDALEFLSATVRQDEPGIRALAGRASVDAGALVSLAPLVAWPVLQACGGRLQRELPGIWAQGYCPVCAAWPILAEHRGLDRSRWLRCGRCAAEWPAEWLRCIYCGEHHHEQLGSLRPEAYGERLVVETCATCRGYIKTVATLQRVPALELLLQDLETIELDLVALDRGYARPAGPGVALHVRLADPTLGVAC